MMLPKIEVKRILYATDLSENARLALAHAVSLSNLYDAGVVIVHALEDSPGVNAAVMAHVGENQWAEIKKIHEESAKRAIIAKQHEENPAMKSALMEVFGNMSVENQRVKLDEVVVRRGNPVDVIIETAESKNCDIIVMGTQGHGGLTRMMLGSTAQKVLKQSAIPVLVVRLPE